MGTERGKGITQLSSLDKLEGDIKFLRMRIHQTYVATTMMMQEKLDMDKKLEEIWEILEHVRWRV